MDWEKRNIIPCVIFHIIIFCNQVYGQENVMTQLSYRSNINHRYAVTWVTAHMENPSDNSTEIFFKMTLPKTAFISGLIMEVKGRNYTSLVKEKEVAREIYDQAKDHGSHAGLVEQSGSTEQNFQVSTNVEARGKVIFYLKYEELLLRNKGKYTQNIQIKPGVKPSKLDVTVHIMENEEITSVEVISLPSDGHNHTDNNILSSSSNDTNVHMVNFNEAVVRYNSQGPEGLYGELTLSYDVKRQLDAGEIQVSGDYFVHFFSPDGLPKMAAHTVFILDVSGSMAGQKLQQLKEAMKKILSDLKPEDSFELISFSRGVETLGVYNASQPEDMKTATDKIKQLRDHGSTNINDALIIGLKNVLKRSQFSANQIVFLTDGQPNVCESHLPIILSNVQKINTAKIPLYSLAFGADADYRFLSKLSYQNRGFARKIPVDSRSDELLRGFYQEIGTPLMADIDIQYPGNAVDKNSIVKKGWSTLQSGNEVVVAAKLNPGVNEVDSKIYGITKTGSHQFKVPRLSKTTQHSEKENFIGRLWAYLTIQDLLNKADLTDDAQKVEELKSRARSLSLKYNFVTKLTSLVVVRPEGLSLEDQETPKENEISSEQVSSALAPTPWVTPPALAWSTPYVTGTPPRLPPIISGSLAPSPRPRPPPIGVTTTSSPLWDWTCLETSTKPSTPRCPDDFELVAEQCLMVMVDWPEIRNWTAARSYCQSKGGDLAQVSDQDALAAYIKGRGGRDYAQFWVGGSNSFSRGHWQWLSTNSSIIQGWAKGEPNDVSGAGEDCLGFVPKDAPNGLYDLPCRWERQFVCEVL